MDEKNALTSGPLAAGRRLPLGPEQRRRMLTIVGEPARSCVVVLGVPHSGLSLCAQILRMLGTDIGGTSGAGPDIASRPEEWQERVLGLFGRGSEALLCDMPLPAGWWLDARLRPALDDISSFLQTQKQENNAFGIGGPQTGRLLPLWLRAFAALNLIPKLVLCLRNPAQVARSLAESEGLSLERGEYRWFSYMVDIFNSLDQHELCLIEYEDWLRDPLANVKNLEDFLGTDWPLSRRDLNTALSDIIDRNRGQGRVMSEKRPHPLVRSLYEAARRRPTDPTARDAIAAMIGQFTLHRQLARPFESEFEQLCEAVGDRRSPNPGETAPELAMLRTQLAERDTALAQARAQIATLSERLEKALDQRAEGDAALARAQQQAELRDEAAARAKSKLAEIEIALAQSLSQSHDRVMHPQEAQDILSGLGIPSLWDRLRTALGLPHRAKRRAAERAAAAMAALREAAAEQETVLGDAAGQIETFAAWLDEADAERAESAAALVHLQREVDAHEAATQAIQAELRALSDELDGRSAALVEAAERAEEMAARREDAEAALTACQNALATLQGEAAEREAALADATDRAKAMAERLATANAEHETVIAELGGRSGEIEASLQRALAERAETDAAYAKLQQEAAKLQQEASERAKALQAAEAASVEAGERAAETAAQLAAAEAKLAEAEQEAGGRGRVAQEAQAELVSVQSELAFCLTEIARVEHAAADWDATASADEAELAALREEMAAREAATDEAAAQAADTRARLEAVEDTLARRQAAINALESRLSEREGALDEAGRQLAQAKAELAAARAELAKRTAASAIAEPAAAERPAAVETSVRRGPSGEGDVRSQPTRRQTTHAAAAITSAPAHSVEPQGREIVGFGDGPAHRPSGAEETSA